MTNVNKLFLNSATRDGAGDGYNRAKTVEDVRATHAAQDDAALTAAFMSGDGESFAALVDRHMPMVYKFAYRYMGDADLTNDVVQDTFIKAWKNIKRFDQ